MRKLKMLIAIIISILPTKRLRILAYNLVFGYKISNSKIGIGTIIAIDGAQIENSRIGSFNIFKGPFNAEIGKGSSIGSFNTFNCDFFAVGNQFRSAGYKRRIKICKNSLITNSHHFDIAGSIILGENTWVAGKGSQFWTHGVGVVDRDIAIGKDCYIGSAVRFAPGVQIGDNVLVGIGSVVTNKFVENYLLIAGSPAKIIKEEFDWKEEKRLREYREMKS